MFLNLYFLVSIRCPKLNILYHDILLVLVVLFDSVDMEHVRQERYPWAASSVPCTELLRYYMKLRLCTKIHIKRKQILFKESYSIYVWITLNPRTKHHVWSIWTRGSQSAPGGVRTPPMRKKSDRNNSLHSVCKYCISKWCLSRIKQFLLRWQVTGTKCFPGLGAMKPWQQRRTPSPQVTEKRYLPLRRARRSRGSGLWLS